MKLVVLGAGAVLVKIMEALHRDSPHFEIIAVGVDKSNLESGRSLLEFAQHHQIPVIAHYSEAERFRFDAILMLSYPPLVTEEYLNKYLFINIHYAPLPRYRGFHGFVWSIINGEKQTGYTIHQVDSGIDSGPIYYQYLTKIEESDTILTILPRVEKHLLENIAPTLKGVRAGATPTPQDEKQAIYVCRRKAEDGLIDWGWNKRLVFNHIRALTPPYTPGAFTFFKNEKLVITKASMWESPAYSSHPGQIVAKIPGEGVLVKCADGVLLVNEVIYGGAEMAAFDLFKTVGYRLGK